MTDKAFRFKKFGEKSRGYPIEQLLELRPTQGDVGLEVEVEGNKFPKSGSSLIPRQWEYTHDGSLRGQDNAEYKLSGPIDFSEVPKAVNDLWAMFKSYGSVLDDSNRTSVHVHLNAQGFHLNRLCAFVSLYLMAEEILTEWCGEHRVGNLFCLRAIDAPYIVTALGDFFKQDGRYRFPQDFHYSGLNLHALAKFGSLEIRSLRGVQDPETLITWVRVLEHIYRRSADFKDPRLVIEDYSGSDPRDFFESVVGHDAHGILEAIGWEPEQVRAALLRGIRLAQTICYSRDWSLYEPVEFKRNPFNRRPKAASPTSLSTLNMTTISLGNFAQWATSPNTNQTTDPIVLPTDDELDQWIDESEEQYSEEE